MLMVDFFFFSPSLLNDVLFIAVAITRGMEVLSLLKGVRNKP